MKKNINNLFITQSVDQNDQEPKVIKVTNKLIKKLGYNFKIKREIDLFRDMNTIEQRINFFHILSTVIENNIEGEITEFGCFTGQCAILFQKILDFNHSGKTLHLYDSFEKKFSYSDKNIEEILLENFREQGLKAPVIHKGLFNETLPDQLPDKIAFAHIDCGFGGDKFQHKEIVVFCLEQIYPKMPKGAVCVLMDYFDPSTNNPGIDCNPGVKLACDDFFKDKPEVIVCLYSNQVPHAYFKKV
ncbi:MAG TPA: TylF/MycF/NovP-related O-methyltransferase [Niabella sp.]|nr:TylF/MycF/NovP-related O-methyltransferase [Niabella sp.]